MLELTYRGYAIQCRLDHKWYAVVLRPTSHLPLGRACEATEEEGCEVAIERAKARVDAEELRLVESRSHL
jgi:hypothetical protein